MFSGLKLANVLGGWAADRWPACSMFAILAALVAVEVALHFSLRVPALVVA
ncbi:hypothetical protein [Pseudorhodoferax sp. Leaf274]|uniref:hypothetical protein n=1 Tax=Pseudorhodoferax sp. Leaf274 TaxID=1736318 RepID=UPI0012E21CFE|nr:hypothetical protein [Pseudorhodoferax sp. Leaf274]